MRFYGKLFILAGPIIVQNMLSVSVNFADNIMVGRLGERAVAGVTLANQVQAILSMLVLGISAAMVLLAAQYWGKRDIESVKKVIAIGFRVCLTVGIAVNIITLAAPAAVLRVFTDDTLVIAEGVKYIRITAFSYIFFCITHTAVAAMRCVESVRVGMAVSFTTLCVSVVLNYLLIFGNLGFPALGIQGAAVSTLSARIAETFIMLVYIRYIEKNLNLRLKDLRRIDRTLLSDFFRHGFPVMLGDVLWGIAGTAQVAIIGRLGEQAIAANSITAVLFQIITVVIWSFSAASAVTIGKTVGSGNYPLVKQYARKLQLLFVSLGLVSSLIFFTLRDFFISLYNFTGDTQVIAGQFMTIMGFALIGCAYHAPCFTGIIRAGGDTRFVLIVDLICAWCVIIPSALLAAFVFHQPPWVVFLCLKSDQFFKWIIAAIKTNRFKWIKNLTRESLE